MNNFQKISRHAISILVGQWAVVAFAVIDSAIAGHINEEQLAALSIGAAIFMTLFVALLGVVMAFLPIAGQLFGAGRYTEIGDQFRQSLYLACGVSLLGLLCLLFPLPLFAIAKLDESKQHLVQSYLNMLAIGFVPAVVFRIYACLNQAISRPLFVTLLQIAALVIKIPLSWFLAIKMEMGIPGCSLSSSLINISFFLVALFLLLKLPIYKPFALFSRFDLPCWKDQKELLKLGIPMGLSNFVEVTGSTFMALLIARFSSNVFSAAHQLMVQLSAIIFQIPLSISIATSAVVAQYIGARKMKQARSAGLRGIRMSIGMTIMASVIIFIFRFDLLNFLTDSPNVLELAATLTAFIAFYQIADAAQTGPAFVLRAYRIAVLPMILYAISLWGVGLGGGYLIAFNTFGISPESLQGPAGFWLGATISLIICAFALNYLANSVSKKRIEDI